VSSTCVDRVSIVLLVTFRLSVEWGVCVAVREGRYRVNKWSFLCCFEYTDPSTIAALPHFGLGKPSIKSALPKNSRVPFWPLKKKQERLRCCVSWNLGNSNQHKYRWLDRRRGGRIRSDIQDIHTWHTLPSSTELHRSVCI